MSISHSRSVLRVGSRTTGCALLLASFLAIVVSGAARATPVGMPAGSTVWMEWDSNACDSDGDSDCIGSNQPGPNPPNGIPLTTFSESNGTWGTGFAEVQPDQVRSFISGYGGGFIWISMLDTYTVHGTAVGPFDITAHLSVSGTASSVLLRGTHGLSAANVDLEIGTFNPSTDPTFHEQWRITAFSSGQQVIWSYPSTFSTIAPFSVSIDAVASYTRSASVGDVFDIAYGATPHVGWGTVDLLDTATISFDLPAGVYLTSALGGTFGVVPEPSTALLFASGLAGLGVARRKRASHH
jgi:hypothetical protein